VRLLVANRGEIALRILRAAQERGVPAVAVTARDEPDAPHATPASSVVVLDAAGPAAYLDVDALVRAATGAGCMHLHPGYGFASESPALARACERAGLGFVGPPPPVLEVLGDKVAARRAAEAAGLPVAAATRAGATLDEVRALLAAHPDGIVVKATSAGGGRGIRVLTHPAELGGAYERCLAEAALASGRPEVYAEERRTAARHVEVQVVGAPDGGAVRVAALGDRDCSVQRAMQKLVEVAPAPGLDAGLGGGSTPRPPSSAPRSGSSGSGPWSSSSAATGSSSSRSTRACRSSTP
jgi:pyruvate carboxylase